MNLSGSTVVKVRTGIKVHGNHHPIAVFQLTRVGGHAFNAALKRWSARGCELLVLDVDTSAPLVPSKNATWAQVAEAIRAGKKVTAKVDAPTPKKKSVGSAKKRTLSQAEQTVSNMLDDTGRMVEEMNDA